MWKWWKDAAQEARQARFAALSAERRMALERPGSAQAADVQLRLGSEPAPCAQGACMDAEQEAWKAELQVGPAWHGMGATGDEACFVCGSMVLDLSLTCDASQRERSTLWRSARCNWLHAAFLCVVRR